MKPPVSDWGRSIVDPYPDPKKWPKFKLDWKADAYRFANLWLTEGIPFAFRERPMVFEYLRERLALRLGEKPKNINITGSARTGFSYAPQKFGKEYIDDTSDFDLFLISKKWFDLLVSDFEMFASRYRAGLAVAENENESRYFKANVEETPSTIGRGFIDQWRVPNRDLYVHAREMYKAADGFRRDLNAEVGAAKPAKRISIRVYREWDNAVGQIGGSMIKCLLSLD